METDHLELGNIYHVTTFKRKAMVFISAWLLSEVALLDPILKFIDHLNQVGIVKMGNDFSPTQIFWGDGIMMNILHVVIASFFAGLSGFLYGYLIKKKSTLNEKILVSIITAILSIFGQLLFYSIVFAILGRVSISEANSIFPTLLNSITSSAFYTTFFLLYFASAFVCPFFLIELGTRVINDPHNDLDKSQGTFLNIKWYHFIWLWLTVGLYGQLILGFIYGIVSSFHVFLRTVRWYEFLGISTSGGDGSITVGDSNGASIGILVGRIGLYIFLTYGAIALLEYLRETLSINSSFAKGKKVVIALMVGLVIPFGVLFLLDLYNLLGR